MIKNNSVRVGNLVNVNDSDFICCIENIGKGCATVSRDKETSILVAYCDLYGVPITKDIINKLGWVKIGNGKESKMPFGICYGLTGKNLYAVLGDWYILITFVHELQNVYYMVEKTEIDISKLLK